MTTSTAIEAVFDAATRGILRLAPQAFRDQFGDVVATTAAAQRTHGGLTTGVLDLIDLLRIVIRLRLGRRAVITERPRHAPFHDRSPMNMRDDFRAVALRMVRRPAQVAPVIALLAVAIGLASAMFGVTDAFLLRPAPFSDPSTLHKVGIIARNGQPPSTPEVARVLLDHRVFTDVRAVVLNASGDVEGRHGTITRRGSRVTPGTFAALGVSPLLGREFVAGEGAPGNDKVVLLSEQVWRSDFDADPNVIGTSIRISNVAHTIVGVMPGSLRFPVRGEGTWRPFDPNRLTPEAADSQMLLFVRRDPAMPEQAAEARAADALRAALGADVTVDLGEPSSGMLDTYSRESIVTLAVGVALLFVILCANVSTLVLARTMARQYEFGICSALGASRKRLVTQSCFELLLTGAIAAALGLALAAGLVRAANAWMPADLAWRTLNPLDLDWRIVIATSTLGVFAALLAGVPAVWLGTRQDVSRSLRLSTRTGSASRSARRLSRLMLVGELALAVALLAGAGLQLRSFVNLVNADRGLDANEVLVATVTLPASVEANPESRPVLVNAVESRVASLPGVAATTAATGLPPDGGDILFEFEIRPDQPESARIVPFMFGYRVAPGFFSTLGIAMEAGREFLDQDGPESVVLSRSLSTFVFGDASPIGRTMTIGTNTYRVVGVAAEIRNSLSDPRSDYPEFYRVRHRSAPGTSRRLSLALRCADPCASPASVQQAIAASLPSAGDVTIAPMADAFMTQLARPQTASTVATGFAALALGAVAVGLFGVLAAAVARRRHEFGIRVALGADPWQIRGSVLRDALGTTVAGVSLGVAVGWALGKWLESVRYGVEFFDPTTWGVVVVIVIVAAMVAAWVPARRAMRVDPVTLLRD